ncbi:MAG: large-conductance mechanosensitive channel protein MscL [Clostridium sp.]|uniref:large-conductance mechanosensitive channel protein MscL n=1 Tax=Clostridium sp. TaxID=1506 RepID=UPI003F311B9D
MKKFISEFKEFALKGNIFDLAIGVVIGGAFNKIVSSLVNDIIMPLIGVLTGGVNFNDLKFVLAEGINGKAVTLNIGMFIQNIIDFLIIALSIFMAIRLASKFNRKKELEEEIENEAEESKEDLNLVLLAEIRDLLKENKVEQ